MSHRKEFPGLFISIEGGEGVGKSSFCQLLSSALETRGFDVLKTREPGGTLIAQKIRELFLDPPKGETIHPLTELFLVSAARAQHVERLISPHLAHPKGLVLCDRFYDSTRVYQGIIGGLDSEVLESIVTTSVSGYHPQLTFLLDCDSSTSLKRVKSREDPAAMNRYDGGGAAFFEKLRQAFLRVARDFADRTVIINTEQPQSDIVDMALEALEQRGLIPRCT